MKKKKQIKKLSKLLKGYKLKRVVITRNGGDIKDVSFEVKRKTKKLKVTPVSGPVYSSVNMPIQAKEAAERMRKAMQRIGKLQGIKEKDEGKKKLYVLYKLDNGIKMYYTGFHGIFGHPEFTHSLSQAAFFQNYKDFSQSMKDMEHIFEIQLYPEPYYV